MNLYKLAMHMTDLFYTYNEPFYVLVFVAKIMNLLSSMYYTGKKKIKGIIIFSSSLLLPIQLRDCLFSRIKAI